MRISDWSSDVCSSDLRLWTAHFLGQLGLGELCLVTQLPQLLSQQVELGTVDGFGHGAVCRRGAPSYIPVSDIENINQARPAMGHETTPALGRRPGTAFPPEKCMNAMNKTRLVGSQIGRAHVSTQF